MLGIREGIGEVVVYTLDSVRGRGCRRRGVWGGEGYETVERGRGGGVVPCER